MYLCGEEIHVTRRILKIAHLESDSYEAIRDPQAIIDGLRNSGVGVDLFTFMQILPDNEPKYPYLMEWDNLAVLQITNFDHWWSRQIRSEARNRARQAEKKGVIVREVPFNSTIVQGIWKIYNESPIRQERLFPHYGKDIEAVRKMNATFPETSIFIGAFLDEELIGFARLVTDKNQTHANIMGITSLMKHRDKAPTNSLIAQAVRSCSDRDIKYLAYQKFTYGKKGADGLAAFKRVNGFEQITLPRYHVSLTRIGTVALRFGLHHGLLDYVPEPVLSKLLELRSTWYGRKYKSFSMASRQ